MFENLIKCVATDGLYITFFCKCHNGVSKKNFKWLMSYTPHVCAEMHEVLFTVYFITDTF